MFLETINSFGSISSKIFKLDSRNFFVVDLITSGKESFELELEISYNFKIASLGLAF